MKYFYVILWLPHLLEVTPPVKTENGATVTVEFAAHLIHLIDVDEKKQIITTNLWLEIEWFDRRLEWKPRMYQNVTSINVPSRRIWKPDIILYNNADGQPNIWQNVDVKVWYNGKVTWKPPMIYKSFCLLDLSYFPYDQQRCHMKFGSWTHDGAHVDLKFRDLDGNVSQSRNIPSLKIIS